MSSLSLRYSIYKVQSPVRRLRVLNRNFAILARTFRFVKRNFSLFCDSACFFACPRGSLEPLTGKLAYITTVIAPCQPLFYLFLTFGSFALRSPSIAKAAGMEHAALKRHLLGGAPHEPELGP